MKQVKIRYQNSVLIVNFVKDENFIVMNARQLKDEINDFLSYADERFLRLVYSMVESERSESGFFNADNAEMVERANKSLKSVDEGKTRSIQAFKKDISSWKESRTIQ